MLRVFRRDQLRMLRLALLLQVLLVQHLLLLLLLVEMLLLVLLPRLLPMIMHLWLRGGLLLICRCRLWHLLRSVGRLWM